MAKAPVKAKKAKRREFGKLEGLEMLDGLDINQTAEKLGEAVVVLRLACEAARRKSNHLIVELLQELRVLTSDDVHLFQEVKSLDYFPLCEGEPALRRYLARNKPLRDLCRRYRPATWGKFAPTPEEIKRETAKWEAQEAKGG